jgi:hypothetical protein
MIASSSVWYQSAIIKTTAHSFLALSIHIFATGSGFLYFIEMN